MPKLHLIYIISLFLPPHEGTRAPSRVCTCSLTKQQVLPRVARWSSCCLLHKFVSYIRKRCWLLSSFFSNIKKALILFPLMGNFVTLKGCKFFLCFPQNKSPENGWTIHEPFNNCSVKMQIKRNTSKGLYKSVTICSYFPHCLNSIRI